MNAIHNLFVWYNSEHVQPPHDEWFFGRYAELEVMPTIIIHGSVCLSVRCKKGEINILQQLGLPPEWRP